MKKLRSVASGFVAACLVTILVPTASAARTDRPDLPAPVDPSGSPVLKRSAHGAAAIERLGDDIGRVARLNKMTVAELERLLLTDRTAWVHPTGRIYYVDPAADGLVPRTPERAPYPYDQTFQLHSRPGAAKSIYIDFDGQTVSGTAWNTVAQFALPAGNHPAFSLDGDPTTFSNAERDVIQSVWQRVSEDYAPFDVDVTTSDPGASGLVKDFNGDTTFGTRALVTPSTSAQQGLCDGSCGGIAFIGTYGEGSAQYQPAWVFPQAMSYDTKAIAEAVSHEVGHNLGLDHDGVSGQDYYEGQGAWAPIMGGSYDRPISQWSKGEYPGASNSQDDLTVITENGLSVMADDHGDTVGGATPVSSPDRTASGLISTASDKDVFEFAQGCAGPVTMTVAPAPTSPNLDVRLRVLTADGTPIATDDPPSGTSTYDVASGMGAAATVTATQGAPLFAEIDGVGTAGTTGYSDYASLGRYTVTSTGCGTTDPAYVSFQSSGQSTAESGTAQLTVVRSGNTAGAVSVGYSATGGTASSPGDYTLAGGRLSFAAGETTKTISVTIASDTVDEADETVQVTLAEPSSGAVVSPTPVSTLTILDDDQGGGGTGAQPDLLISKNADGPYSGDGTYETTGGQQAIGYTVLPTRSKKFFVRVTNDGSTTETIRLLATQTGKQLSVTYTNGSQNVTALLTSGNAQVVLAPDQFALIRVSMVVLRRAAAGSVKSVTLTATSSDGSMVDAVRGVVTVGGR